MFASTLTFNPRSKATNIGYLLFSGAVFGWGWNCELLFRLFSFLYLPTNFSDYNNNAIEPYTYNMACLFFQSSRMVTAFGEKFEAEKHGLYNSLLSPLPFSSQLSTRNSNPRPPKNRNTKENIPYICDLGARFGCKRISEHSNRRN